MLPVAYLGTTGPTTVEIGDAQVRIQGSPDRTGYVVVGQTTRAVDQARTTLVLAELIIAPILLIVVFLGAVAIGRRVAAPIEQARRSPARVHGRRLARAADPAVGHRGAHEPGPGAGTRRRRGTGPPSARWTSRASGCGGWSRTCSGWPGSTRRASRRTLEPVDLGVLASETVDRFRVVAEARGLAIELRVDAGDHIVHVPPEWLDRLLGVLLDNACKYAPRGTSVVVTVANDAGRVRLTVDDAGPGIPEEQRARIFDRFHRATESTGGAGLGLAIADAIVRTTGGRWRVGASPAGGASMSVAWKRETA